MRPLTTVDIGLPSAVLFDRDGTLVVDVPYNGDPDLVRLMPGAARAVHRLRERGIPVGLVTNQSGIARGLITRAQADAVNTRLSELVGPFDNVQVCPHGEADGCSCRKPAPGMVLAAAQQLRVDAAGVVVVGDIGADMGAAAAAGAQAILVPTAVTRAEEVAAAARTAPDLSTAVDLLLSEAP